MRFIERDLETIIWENYLACEKRGLSIQSSIYEHGLRFRQLSLMPYGIADLVNIYYEASTDTCWIQVIECKKEKVDYNTYLQAKRYEMALVSTVIEAFDRPMTQRYRFQTILIGASYDSSGPVGIAVAQDDNCRIFTYRYELDGIRFESQSTSWNMDHWQPMADHTRVTTEKIKTHIEQQQFRHRELEHRYQARSKALIITSDGILLNPMLYGSSEEDWA